VSTVIDGVIIGSAGGAIGGITVYLVQYLHNKISDKTESERIYKWLNENTSEERGEEYRSTRTIASFNNLTQDRVRYLCSIHDGIHLSTGVKEDMWALKKESI